MKKSILQQIHEKVQEMNTPEGYRYGTVVRINPIKEGLHLKKGSTILTPKGLGVVSKQSEDSWNGKVGDKVVVYLKRKYHKTFKVNEVFQYAIFNGTTGQFVLLSPLCYNHIGEPEQEVCYRLTNHPYALMSKESMDKYAHYAYLNKQRSGPVILSTLKAKGFILINTKQPKRSFFKDLIGAIRRGVEKYKRARANKVVRSLIDDFKNDIVL